MTATIDTGALNALLTQMAEAAKSASDAAKAAKVKEGTPDWSKLLTKPSSFDHKSQEEEIKHFKDWSWQLVQYVSAIDSDYTKDLEDLANNPNTPLDLSTASTPTRERSTKLYGLLAGLLRGRALQTLKAVPNADGYEAWRQLLLTLRPTSKNRGLALMSAIMGWPGFQMNQAVQPQLLKLEDAFEEARRASVTIQDEMKIAVLLRCLSGQLRTHVSLQLSEGMSYGELRECLLKWDRAQQRWGHLIASPDATPMEIDRVEWKGGKKGDGKKGGGKEPSKGKKGGKDGKGKSYGKKGEYKGKNGGKKGEGKGKGAWDGKGKGKESRDCWKCGKTGHLAKDCLRQVQEVQQPEIPGSGVSTAGSSSTTTTSTTSTSGWGGGGRVARVIEAVPEHYVFAQAPTFFDMREEFSSEGSIRVVTRHYIGDEDEKVGEIRAIAEQDEEDDKCEPVAIIIDSGADAPIFPSTWRRSGRRVEGDDGRRILQDAQGNKIPTQGKREVEVTLKDSHGRKVVFREKVTISDAVSQPILCFGKMMEQGWSIDGREQMMVHHGEDYEIKVPVEMQNRSVTVMGYIRVVQQGPHVIRMMTATVDESLKNLAHGWSINDKDMMIGYHIGNQFQEPMQGGLNNRMRTTLVQSADGGWTMVEFCEDLNQLLFLDGPFEERAMRPIITILTKDTTIPEDMGFILEDEFDINPRRADGDGDAAAIPIAPDEEELEQKRDDDGERRDDRRGDMVVEKAEEKKEEMDKIVVAPFDPQLVVVNGIEMTVESSLASLRAALAFYGKSTSGGKQRCFRKLVDHMRQMELEVARDAAVEAQKSHFREPKVQPAAQRPGDAEVERHCLTHVPYAPWCEHCIAHRARPDRHERSDLSKEASIPTISFDFCFTKALEEGEKEADVSSSTWLVMADSHSGYLGCCPLRGKGQIKLATHEIMSFTQNLGYSAVCFSTDNEPTTRQILRCLINARHSMGLPTRISTSKIADHSNALAENAVNRIRGLAGTFMDEVQTKIGMKLNTNNTIWSWAARHAAWILNRYRAVRGATPYELIYGKPYRGVLGKFGEPVYAYLKTHLKGERKWHKALFLGKIEGQDSFIVYDGSKVLLTKSIRRIGQEWGLSLAYYKEFNCPTFDYQTGFGSRIIPTKREAVALPALPNLVPLESIAVKAKDLEAEAVIKKAIEENREEEEARRMLDNDPKTGALEAAPIEDVEEDAEKGEATEEATTTTKPTSTLSTSPSQEGKRKNVIVVDDNTTLEALMQPRDVTIEFKPSGGASGSGQPLADEARSSPTTRGLDEREDEREGKRLRTEDAKKARINRMKDEMEAMVRAITIGDEVFYTLDEEIYYGESEDLEWDTEEIQIPEELWLDGTQEEKPKDPEDYIDKIADQLELGRLIKMEVIKQANDEDKNITRSVTTKFVRDLEMEGVQSWRNF